MRLEQRLSPRINVVISATIIFDGGRARLPCVVRNLSDGGAKIEVNGVSKVPPTFDLVMDRKKPRRCRVVWRALRELGVAFA